MESVIDKKERAIREYFRMWITEDFDMLNEIFTPDCTYQEPSGKCFLSLVEVQKWIINKRKIERVLKWDIKNIWPTMDNTFFVLWNYTADGESVCNFDGISIIQFDRNEKIKSVREYQSTSEHEFPYHF